MLPPDGSKKSARCIFEYIYFGRPDSYMDGVSVYESRIRAGRFLAIDSPVDADIVVGVPESGNAAALGYSLQSGIPLCTALCKELLCRPYLHQAEAEQPGVKCAGQIKRAKRSGCRKARHHDRRLDRPWYDERPGSSICCARQGQRKSTCG